MSLHCLMFGWEYPPKHAGGLGVACQGLVKGLKQNNVDISLALPHSGAEEEDVTMVYPTKEHVSQLSDTIYVPSALQPYDTHTSYTKRLEMLASSTTEAADLDDVYGENLNEAIHSFTELSVEMTKHLDPDVVHCHDWMTYGAAAKASRHHRKPMVAHIHATELDRTHFSPHPWIYKLEKDGFMAADHIIAVSEYTKNVLVNRYGIGSSKISVVHNGSTDAYDAEQIAINSQARKKKRPMVLFLGRFAVQKGVQQFLNMAAVVHAHRPDVQFVMAGSGHLLNETVDRAIELGLENNILFTGKVSSKEGRELYANASCFVMPSLSEPFGLVALEAASQGTPVVLSRQSGAKEVMSHCFAVDFWDTEKMADCVLTILRDEHLADQLVSEAPRILTHLTWENQSGLVRSIYENVT